MNNIGIGDDAIEAMRLAGVGWIFAFFVVGATILAGAGWSAGKCGGLRESWAANWSPVTRGALEGATATRGNRREARPQHFTRPQVKAIASTEKR
jgi:hypothetical protein